MHSLPSFAETRTAGPDGGLKQLAQRIDLAVIAVEPIQMTGGGHEIPESVCDAVLTVARERSVPVLFDETLTGFFRCGSRFYFDAVGHVPDILVLGKGLANGFPAAAVVIRRDIAWDRARVKPGSTFWNHPLACAAVSATLGELSKIDATAKVRRIDSVVRHNLGMLELHGRGAMWCVGAPQAGRLAPFVRRLLEAGIVVSYYDRYIRLLPPLTIVPDVLESVCRSIREAHADTFG